MLIALVLARVIAEAGSPAPILEDGDALLIKRRHVQIGGGCVPSGDAGVDAGGDAGPLDAGVADAGPGDAGTGDAGTDAGCEVITGDAVTLVVQPRFSQVTTGARFAVLMVAPDWPLLEAAAPGLFVELDAITEPKVVEHITRVEDPALGKQCGSDVGCSFAPVPDDPTWEPPGLGDAGVGGGDGGYTIDTVGPYEILRARPASTAELETWLAANNYLTLPADVAAVAPYIARGYAVVAVRVPVVSTPERDLPPIAITWPGSELRLPVAIGGPAGAAAHETTVYIAGPGRFELPGAAVPFAWRTGWGGEAGFLTKNVVVLESNGNPDEDPVAIAVPEVAERDTIDVYTTRRVPVTDCEVGCAGCSECNARRPVRGDWIILLAVVLLTLRQRRRRR